MKIKVFDYHSEYDAFTATTDFRYINGFLGLTEWTPVVWITRLFCMDNDFGEHVFDNWTERELLEKKFGIDAHEYLIIVPSRFKDGRDGPCHSDEIRKLFWTDVCKSLELDLETIFTAARFNNEEWKKDLDDDVISSLAKDHYAPDLEEKITKIRKKYGF